ncbi:hypothetical protein BKA59DRAFT_504619 [Fusarium tricinctum]|uniref:Uncharacterized protein n=1 Tax=Fusarium tricinctum TaxID=61284 RepID=A0A8K0WGS2_9HYPO|nr:hypothetical protein BKA59DRAFT_504619 [Fusarium tricinctum]
MPGSVIVEKRKLIENDLGSGNKSAIVNQIPAQKPRPLHIKHLAESLRNRPQQQAYRLVRMFQGLELVENGEPIPPDPGDPTNFATYSQQNTVGAPEVSEQPIGVDEEFASSNDPILIRREQTRLRVQRYRARQHKLRLEAAAATSDPLNAVGYTSQDDVLSGLQDITVD